MEIHETQLPGVGLRHDLSTRSGRQLGVVTHQTGKRDLVVYDKHDPDASQEVIHLTDEESDALADLLGADRIIGHLGRLQQQIEGLAIDWLEIRPGSPFANRTIADTRARTRTGVSIVAVLHDGNAVPAPGPEYRFQPDDTVVVVGTPKGVKALAVILDA